MVSALEPESELEALFGPATAGSRSNEAPVTVLYIGGTGRSGSTLLDRILDRIPGLCSVGEVVHLWRRGVRDNELCACRRRFGECPFWAAVGAEAYGGWEELDPRELLSLQHSVDRNRFIPFMENRTLWPRYQRKLRAYGQYLSSLYRGIRSATGASVIVDSTKHASTAFLLRRLPSIDLRLVHLVRDSRGVAYSWTKRVRRPEVVGQRAFMARWHPVRTGARWVAYNALLHRLSKLGTPSIWMKYESLVARPRDEVGRVLRFLGMSEDDLDLDFIGPDAVDLTAGHSVAGNPMRFQNGSVPLRLDEEWRHRLNARDRAIVSAMTWPLLARYGYRVPGSREETLASR